MGGISDGNERVTSFGASVGPLVEGAIYPAHLQDNQGGEIVEIVEPIADRGTIKFGVEIGTEEEMVEASDGSSSY